MKILTKVIAVTTGAVVESGECYVVGAELNDETGDALLEVYNAGSAVTTQLFVTLRVTDEAQFASIMFPMPGLKCDNVFSVLTGDGGAGTLYYYY